MHACIKLFLEDIMHVLQIMHSCHFSLLPYTAEMKCYWVRGFYMTEGK